MTSTICALATPQGQGGIAVLRISGDAALEVLRGAFEPAHIERAYEPWRMMYGRAVGKHGETLDEVLAVYMPGPRSYTREDVAEIHCHGGMVSARVVLERLIQLGAIPAQPGEFTKRAYLNGRIDLTRAEAVMALIGAGSEAEARASVRQLEGGVSGFVRGGLMIGAENYTLEGEGDQSVAHVLGEFLPQYYDEGRQVPEEVL
ncbi:MAG: hypothetical protein IJ074_06810, partial [Clostridia bacterium]|nr:hypothetical protein [Clostridia bacterium]